MLVGGDTENAEWRRPNKCQRTRESPVRDPRLPGEFQEANTHVPVSFWLAPGAAHNTYFADCLFDELCAAGGKDPVESRRRLLATSPRLLNCLNVAAEKAGCGTPAPAARFRGVALCSNVESFNGSVHRGLQASERVIIWKTVPFRLVAHHQFDRTERRAIQPEQHS